MNYSEMVRFLNENGIDAIQPIIAGEVDAQLETNITDEEFEDVCNNIFGLYLGCIEEPDMWSLVDEELTARGYKNNNVGLLEDLRMEQQEQM